MKTGYRSKLRDYLTQHNLTLAEFCEWSGLPLRGLVSGREKYAQQVHIHLLQRHPLATPRIPADLPEKIEAFRQERKLTLQQLAQRWGVNETTLLAWRKSRPSPRHWRTFCKNGGYADIMQTTEPEPRPSQSPPPNPAFSTPFPVIHGKTFSLCGDKVFHPKHGWTRATAVQDGWATVQCQDGVERYFLLPPSLARKLQGFLRG